MTWPLTLGLLALACSSTSVNDEAGGAAGSSTGGTLGGGAGGAASVGGGASASGGADAGGGTSANGGGGAGGAGGSAVGGTGACSPPYVAQLGAAAAALPKTFTWGDFSSYEVHAGCPSVAIWQCSGTPCAQCPITWKTITPSATKLFVDFEATCAAPGKYGCPSSGMGPCGVGLSGSGTATFELAAPNASGATVAWTVTKATVLGTWAGGSCSYFHIAEASQDLNTEMGKAMPATLSASCP
ncbi:MAG: hypothetical protein HYZ29_27435 [Myxococcales bacterium]|nr:hypothetical protein [Myxococcales bacterium]